MIPTDLATLARLVEERCILRGQQYTLSSGKKSDYYYDGKRALLAADLKLEIGRAMLNRVSDVNYQIAGGVAVGSVLLAETMSVLALLEDGRSIDTFFVRDTRKAWGTGEKTSQAYLPGDPTQPVLREGTRVLVVDDVVTTGTSLQQAFDVLKEVKAEVAAVAVIVDRQDDDARWLRDRYDFRPLFEADHEGRLSVVTERVAI